LKQRISTDRKNEENNKVISKINAKLDEALIAKENAQKMK